jgi:hypothetical protein
MFIKQSFIKDDEKNHLFLILSSLSLCKAKNDPKKPPSGILHNKDMIKPGGSIRPIG